MLTNDEFGLFRNLIYAESGIYLKDTRKDYLENRLVKRMRDIGIASPYWYYKYVIQRKKTELLILLDLLTVNETSFFRNKPQMDLFVKVILPELVRRKRPDGQKKLMIWSAGCSTGEEPYSIAMAVLETVPWNAGWEVRVFGSDLSLSALEVAAKGEYSGEKIIGAADEHYLERYFEKKGDKYRVKDVVRKMVVFDLHNLKTDVGLRNLDVIFCRNVMIYFDAEEQRRLVRKFYESLEPGGYLLLGHAESLHGMNTGLRFVYSKNATAYKKAEKAGER